MTEKQIKKVLRPVHEFLLIFIICVCITAGLYFLQYYRAENSISEAAVDYIELCMEYKDEEETYVKADVIDAISFAEYEGEEDRLFYFVYDKDYNFFIARLGDATFNKMYIQYQEQGDEFEYQIDGWVYDIPKEIKEIAIYEYNQQLGTEDFKLTEDNFEEYFGNTYVDECDLPDDIVGGVITIIGFVVAAIGFIFLIAYIVNVIRFAIFKSKYDLDIIRHELSKPTTKVFAKPGVYMTSKYIVSKANSFLYIVDYYDLAWIYISRNSYNGIPVSAFLKGRTKDKKTVILGSAYVVDKFDPVIEEIVVRNSNVLIGYTHENLRAYAEMVK